MADRVHPRETSPPPTTTRDNNDEENGLPVSAHPQHGKSVSLSFPPGRAPAPGTYVVQLPKDQILRYPPPPSRLPYRARNPRKRSRCCCCCLCMLITLITLIVLSAIFAGVIYFVYNPKAPKYTIDNISIQGFNLSSPSSTYSPKMDVTVRAQNPNGKIGIYYVKGSSVSVSHSNVGDLCTGVLPVFYQPTKNTTVFNTTLNDEAGSMMLSTENYQTIRDEQRKKQIPLRVNMKVPVKIKFGSIKTWKITVKVHCSITVDSLAKNASILSDRTKCSVKVKPWG
ncbi:hypothetical protein ACHQM5_012159 [Ranunculus cassubicifolius]